MPSHPTLRALAAWAAAVSAAALLASCGGGSSGESGTQAARPEALRAARPGELVDYFKSRLVKRGTQGFALPGGTVWGTAGSAVDAASSGTNLQEAGVDEDDLLKTDGSFVYALHPAYGSTSRLEARRIQSDGSLGSPASVALDSQTWPTGMYLTETARRVVVLGQQQSQQQLTLDIYDVAEDAQPAHATQVLIDGYTVSTRRIGNVLYVASTWAPDLSRYWLPYGATTAQAEAAVAGLSASALLPTIRVGSGPAQPLVAEQDCQVQPASASLSLQLTTITAIDLSTPALERRSRCFIGDGGTLYMSPSAAYVATSRNYWIASDVAATLLPEQTSTDIHKFALQGLEIDYRGSAEVAGHLGWDAEKMPYRMSEYQGDLRVLTFTGPSGWGGGIVFMTANATAAAQTAPPPASPATLTVLREDTGAGRLTQVATLPNSQRPAALGHEGEQVYAVHFAGPLAYVVTFRRTDPLYVLDLSNPADPKIASELTMPGFSDYLFPLANGKLLGVGKDASADGLIKGLKIALFDVSDPSQPFVLASHNLGARGSASALDYSRHGISLLQQGPRTRIALPVNLVTASGSTRQGLARYVVNTELGTLQVGDIVPAVPIEAPGGWEDYFNAGVWKERSVQTANATYYLSGGTVTYIAQAADGALPAEFVAARQSWDASGLLDYRFDLLQACMCPSEGAITVVVRGGRVISATFAASGQPVSAERLRRIPSMGVLYSALEDAYANRVASVHFTLNSTQGDLRETYIEDAPIGADGQVSYLITNFQSGA